MNHSYLVCGIFLEFLALGSKVGFLMVMSTLFLKWWFIWDFEILKFSNCDVKESVSLLARNGFENYVWITDFGQHTFHRIENSFSIFIKNVFFIIIVNIRAKRTN
ncbi:hypothetical protein J3Q64DRAFT_1264241 [Phycomyces blakesleeanus]|uniref:Uncharacterized protein n=1 Tax=Phycomyces blakesleeanus TaxID=4837 RepID=A0ABR3APM8_PHYBL